MSDSPFQVQPRTQPLIYVWCKAAARGRLNTISWPVFHERNIPKPNSQSWETDVDKFGMGLGVS